MPLSFPAAHKLLILWGRRGLLGAFSPARGLEDGLRGHTGGCPTLRTELLRNVSFGHLLRKLNGIALKRAPCRGGCYPDLMKRCILLLAAGLAWGQQQPPPAATDDPVVLTVGNEKITQSQFEAIVGTLPAQQRNTITGPEQRRQVAQQLVELKTLAQEARAKKLDQNGEVKTKLALQADQVLASAEFQALGSGATSEADMRAFYDAHKADWEEVTARHILIRFQGSQAPLRLGQKELSDEEALQKAKDLRAKIAAGAKFAEVAQAESDDTGSGANGGDLGAFTKGRMVPEFEKAAFSQPIGEVGEPVKTQFGYHLILVVSRKSKPFEDAKAEIEKQLGPAQAQKGLDDLKKKTPVVFNETYFGK
jgi:peptidyl-prolyl cis-trans isomerase C